MAMELHADSTLKLAQAVLKTEAQSILDLLPRLDESFVRACDFLLHCQGRVVVTGMGKSGHIGSKIAATLASTGTPAFFVHPGEASHGDLGMITPTDVVLALSNSGETDEILTIVPLIRRQAVPLIAMTGNPNSSLGREASVHLDISVKEEACPLGLAPTSSTTATLAMGDALAVALLEARGFTADDFARSHPGGRLGRRLLLHVADIMHKNQRIPRVSEDAPMAQALMEITKKGLGMTTITDPQGQLLGVYTDGDLRRNLDQGMNVHDIRIGDVMTRQCKAARPDMLAVEALKLMEDHAISALPVVDAQGQLLGAIHMHDLLVAGVV
ncbi:arabinose-5-phosphate isomerase [Ectothiorhodosinus mongolicus]|uniref:Arabinose 5-phosphate isomerase n=2 Tax=Ectothiorhodosinus mongolicus TaxID=233100 RepID=A0A1R3VQD1_9GAMM|nr:arabinose-5-phosphate isomerase [Ectothiorhodosinus mongolicus]